MVDGESSVSDQCESLLERILGRQHFDSLVAAMLDFDVAPIDLANSSNSGELAGLRDGALDRLRSDLGREREEDLRKLRSALPWHLQDCELARAVLEIGTWRRYFAVPSTVYAAPQRESRVLSRFPFLAERIDGKGLIYCDGLDAQERGLFIENHVIYYHQFLRRGYAGTTNYPLLRVLLEAAQRPENSLRLAIDDRRLVLASDFRYVIEEDYWYGPHLTEATLDDPRNIGHTHHEDPAGDPPLRDARAFCVQWSIDSEGQKVVQMEEVVTSRSGRVGEHYLLRYLHSIRDVQRGVFTHCDGAVRAYDHSSFAQRQNEHLPRTVDAARYRKVFRIDGSITTKEWSDIVAKWFRHNHLVSEYLESLSKPNESA